MVANKVNSIFKDDSSWLLNSARDPDSVNYIQSSWIQDKLLHMQDQRRWHSILALIPTSDESSAKQNVAFKWKTRKIRIAWTMTIFGNSANGGSEWGSQDYLSTLDTCSVPTSGAEFFQHLVQYLEKAWLDFCDSIDSHLEYSVSLTCSILIYGIC